MSCGDGLILRKGQGTVEYRGGGERLWLGLVQTGHEIKVKHKKGGKLQTLLCSCHSASGRCGLKLPVFAPDSALP